ncbi:unnamed protein product [Chondrus crispus]|uniref:Uncharacterized protein n=1 Tax=Chondrus crispus TaxID=2769 RepID=R7Q9P6_CHOCR|nr:unnamed protein product [Chondrus crispus]CDF34111.1 unnamed protein product [Chondrus crispus]|eukprot:XP_005713929.1 unnamed protein product [Chondrus crispus]
MSRPNSLGLCTVKERPASSVHDTSSSMDASLTSWNNLVGKGGGCAGPEEELMVNEGGGTEGGEGKLKCVMREPERLKKTWEPLCER